MYNLQFDFLDMLVYVTRNIHTLVTSANELAPVHSALLDPFG
jgi:hypothetical protein